MLWTRLVSDVVDPHDTGIDPQPLEVDWQVATDPHLRNVERQGTAWALPQHAHSVHVIVDGLRPGREYWYRFRCERWVSATGRTRTAPRPGEAINRLDIAAASCQAWSAGYYTAHRHLAAELPDAVVFLGDYIYERTVDERECGRVVSDTAAPSDRRVRDAR